MADLFTPTPECVTHTTGLTFTVISGDSPRVRLARGVRQLQMTDGTTWTVGCPIGWHGREAAWHSTETPAHVAARRATYGESIRRRDRIQLGLQLHTTADPDMDEALRRARASRQAVTR